MSRPSAAFGTLSVVVTALAAWVLLFGTDEEIGTTGPLASSAVRAERGVEEGGALAPIPGVRPPGASTTRAVVSPGGGIRDEETRDVQARADLRATLQGTVLDPEGRPLKEAGVRASGSSADLVGLEVMTIATRRDKDSGPKTGADGRFRLDLDAGKPYRLEIFHDFYVPARLGPITLAAGEERTLPPLRLRPGGAVAGRVTSTAGLPLAGAYVRAVSGAGMPPSTLEHVLDLTGRGTSAKESETDEDGYFLIRGLPTGKTIVKADLNGYLPARSAGLDVQEGSTLDGVDLQLRPGLSIEGVVRDPDGEAVEGARVTARPESGPRPDPILERPGSGEETDAEGRFRFAGLDGGDYTLQAEADGWGEARLESVPAGEGNVVLTLARPGRLTGRVSDRDTGSAIPEALVEAIRERAPSSILSPSEGSTRVVTTTDEEGEFAFERLPPGTYKLAAEGSGYARREIEGVRVAPGETAGPVSLALELGARIAGTVVRAEDGSPIEGATVGLARRSLAPSDRVLEQIAPIGIVDGFELERGRRTRSTGSDGRFAFDGLDPGDYALTATASDLAPAPPLSLSLRRGEVRDDLRLDIGRGGTIAGTVVDTLGRPCSGRTVRIRGTEDAASRPARRTTDAMGGFRAGQLAPGRYVVSARDRQSALAPELAGDFESRAPDALAADERTVEVHEGAVTNVELVTEATHVLWGLVTAQGEPVEGARIRLEDERKRDPGLLMWGGGATGGVTDHEGVYRIGELRPGVYTAKVSKPSSPVPLEERILVGGAEEQRQDFVLPMGVVTGRVRNEGGQPVAGARVSIRRVRDAAPKRESPGVLARLTRHATNGGTEELTFVSAGGTLPVSTDEQGRYRIEELPSGRFAIEVRHADYSPSIGEIEVGTNELRSGVDFTLTRGGSISGTVVDVATGRPLARIPVRALGSGPEGNDNFGAVTDREGRFTISGLLEGSWTLRPGGVSFSVDGKAVSYETTEKSVSLKAGERLEGVVLSLRAER